MVELRLKAIRRKYSAVRRVLLSLTEVLTAPLHNKLWKMFLIKGMNIFSRINCGFYLKVGLVW